MTISRPPIEIATTLRDFVKETPAKNSIAKENSLPGRFDLRKHADHIVLDKYVPPGVLINEDMEVLQFRGKTGYYLEPAPGAASLNVIKMAREGLAIDLRATIHQAKKPVFL